MPFMLEHLLSIWLNQPAEIDLNKTCVKSTAKWKNFHLHVASCYAVVHKCTEARSDANVESMPKSEKELLVNSQMTATAENSGQVNGKVQMQNHCNKSNSPDKGTKEVMRNVLENMPCVSTKGDGPDGRRIEGFLYRYKKGEEVRIVCVCHGSFLTPAEFVKHAGGGDVPHPLKHIVVNPTALL